MSTATPTKDAIIAEMGSKLALPKKLQAVTINIPYLTALPLSAAYSVGEKTE